MLTESHTLADAAVVTLRCTVDGCSRCRRDALAGLFLWQNAQGRHLANLLAAGPWRCPAHKRRTDGLPDVQEVPC